MEFFEFARAAEPFIKREYWRWAMIYGAAGFLVMFVFQAIALYTIASRNGIEHKWMAFVPILSTYYIGICSRKNKALGLDSKVVAIIVASLEFALCVGYIMHYVGYHFAEQFIQDGSSQEFYWLTFTETTIPYIDPELAWAGFCYQTLLDILDWVNLVYLFMQVMLISAFFQTYAARRYILFTILSVIFPVKAIFFFVVRKNKGMNYREYVMREQERRYRIYRQYNQNNQYNQYNQNNPNNGPSNYGDSHYGHGEYPGPDTGNADPFEEFGNSDDDPFAN